ncbi:MAG: hypothetical protein JWN48_4227 [Myxococcaceae bacterium]|nr:hypothetical protein [Myxococcaceae bacterium]
MAASESAIERVFLLSPARCSGLRAEQLVHSQHELGRGLRGQGAPLGQVFAFLSSLYFRGKLSYAARFGGAALGAPGVLVITPGHGLCRPATLIRATDLAAMAQVEVDADNPSFVQPLLRDTRLLAATVAKESEIVLLGSIATPKYVDPLLSLLGERLLFPREFVGRGDMSRGGMLLRAAREARELEYVPVQTSARSGRRARRLADLRSDEG